MYDASDRAQTVLRFAFAPSDRHEFLLMTDNSSFRMLRQSCEAMNVFCADKNKHESTQGMQRLLWNQIDPNNATRQCLSVVARGIFLVALAARLATEEPGVSTDWNVADVIGISIISRN